MTDLQCMQSDLAGNYQLAQDFDATGYDFVPVGNFDAPFTGTLDGNGFAISNLTIKSTAREVGLFGVLRGQVSNLRLLNVNINASPNDNCAPHTQIDWQVPCVVGSLAGLSSAGGASYVSVQGSVTGTAGPTNNRGSLDIGGIFGEVIMAGIEFSESNVTIAGKLKGSAGEQIGGLSGEVDNGGIEYSSSLGSVSAVEDSGVNSDYAVVGGVIGNGQCVSNSSYCTFADNSYSAGSVSLKMTNTNPGSAFAGGFVGLANGNINSAFSTGDVSSSGIAGGFGAVISGLFRNVYASGSTTASGSGDSGGFAGVFALGGAGGSLNSAYSTGRVRSKSGLAGGLLAECRGTGCGAGFSYWDVQTSGQSTSASGTGLKTNQFKNGRLPDGFDPSIWMPVAFPIRFESLDALVNDYPRLWALPFPITHFPLAGQSPYGSDTTNPPGAEIISVMDHSMPWEKETQYKGAGVLYRCDDIAMAFTGATGKRKFGTDDPNDKCHTPGDAQNARQSAFTLGGTNYYGVSGNTKLLNYDGHPAFDFAAYYEPVYAAASGTLFYPWEAVGMSGNPYHAYCYFHALGEVPDSATTYRIYYLHLATHPAGIDPYSPPCTSPGDTKGQTVTIQSDWIDPSCIYKDQSGAQFAPTSLPLPGGTHVYVPQNKLCVIAESGDAGVPGAPHLHFEIQLIVPTGALPAGNFAGYFPCYNEDSYEGGRDKNHLCIPADPYGWTGAATNCPNDGSPWTGDTWQCLTGIPSRRFWTQ